MMNSQVVPRGYKQTKIGIIPEDWKTIYLEKLLTFKNGVNATKEQYGNGYKFINVLDIINNQIIKYDNIIGNVNITEKEFKLYEVKYGDILFQRSSETREEVGQTNIYVDKEKTATFGGFVIKGTPKQKYNPFFMNYLLKIQIIRNQIISRSGGSTRYNIGQNSLNQVVISLPPLKEQQKIANILTTWDDAISKQNELIKAKEKLKKGLLQKLLSGEIRFSGFYDEWEEVRFSKFLTEVSQKSKIENEYQILSSTIKDMELRDGRVDAKTNIGYKILKKNQLVLSPQNLWLGNINFNTKFKIGLVSPSGPFKNLCQSGKITNTQGHTDEYRNRCRAVCS